METAELANYIAIASAIISFSSAIYSKQQARLSKKSYKLQLDAFNSGKVNFTIHNIEDCFLYNRKEEQSLFYFFKINISNLSDKSTSINKIQLHLLHNNSDIFIMNVSSNIVVKSDLHRLSFPTNISAHNSEIGWIVFEIERTIFNQLNIDSHFIYIQDIHGVNINKEEIYIRVEVVDYEI